jgi:uncharacterized protein (DUF2267 family)
VLVDALKREEIRQHSDLVACLVAVASRLPPVDAAQVCQDAARVLVDALGRKHQGARDLVAGLMAVADRLPPADAARVLTGAFELKDLDPESKGVLATGLAMAGRLPPANAEELCRNAARLLAATIAQKKDTGVPGWLAEDLAELADWLPPAEAEDLCRGAAQVLAGGIDWMGLSSHGRRAYMAGLAAVAGRLPPADTERVRHAAARAVSDALNSEADTLVRARFAADLGVVIDWLSPADAERVCRNAARVLAESLGLQNLNSGDKRVLAAGLAAVAGRLSPADANRVCMVAIDTIRRVAAGDNDSSSQMAAEYALAVLSQHLDAEGCKRLVLQHASQICSSRTANKSSDHGYRPDTLDIFLSFTPTAVVRERTTAAATAVGMGVGPIVVIPAVPSAAAPFPCRLTTQELVDLLKMPTCIGDVRKVVLKHLSNRYGRPFPDHWAFVRYATEQKLGLDFTSPPRRAPDHD